MEILSGFLYVRRKFINGVVILTYLYIRDEAFIKKGFELGNHGIRENCLNEVFLNAFSCRLSYYVKRQEFTPRRGREIGVSYKVLY